MITTEQIKNIILEGLPGARVVVEDMMGTGDHFDVLVESSQFAGKTLMKQHKMVFEILKNEMNERIHALQIKTKILK